MDARRFDDLIQTLADGFSRRRALRGIGALALGRIGSFSDVGVAAGACAICQKKKKGKCKPRPRGAPCGDGGSCCTAGLCCDKEQTCFSGACQGCPGTSACSVHPVCGHFSDQAKDYCLCISSVEGTTTCSSLFGRCFACDTDQDCTDAFGGVPGVCLDLTGCTRKCGDTNRKACFIQGCALPPAAVATGPADVGGLHRMGGVLPWQEGAVPSVSALGDGVGDDHRERMHVPPSR